VLKILKKYYLIISAIVCSILFSGYYFQTYSTNYSRPIDNFKSSFWELEEDLDNSLRYRVAEIKKSGVNDQWNKLKENEDINIHIYRNDSLIFWNTNQLPIIRFADIHFPARGLLHLQNGWYYAKIKEVDGYLICGSFLIKSDYSYKNKELINDFSKRLKLPFNASVSLEQENGFPVFSSDKKFVLSILPADYQSANYTESIVLMLLLLTALILWLYWLTKIKKHVNHRWSWLLPVGLIILRLTSLKFSWFGFMHGTTAFDPSIYGTNEWIPNFFEFLANIAVMIYLLHDVSSRLKKNRKSTRNWFVAILAFCGSFLLWGLYLYITGGLIENSSIPLVIDKLFSLDIFSVIAIASLGVFFFAYYNFVKTTVEVCKTQMITGAQLAVISFIVSCIFFFYEINYGYQLFLASVFPLVFYELILYIVYRRNKTNHLGTGIILLLLFSIVTAANFEEFNERKEHGERELYANQLTTEKNIVTEVEYKATAKQLKEDNFFKRFISYPYDIGLSDFQEGIERRVFNGFWERYEMEFHLFSEKHQEIIDKGKSNTELYDELQEIIDRSGTASAIDTNIFFINDNVRHYSYLIRQELYGKDSTLAILFCTLKSKKIPEEIGFPRLLISSKANVLESLESYSIGKYHKGKMINKYGSFNYPSSNDVLVPSSIKPSGFFNFDGFNHFALRRLDDHVIVLSIKNSTLVDFITSFSYLFSFFGFLLLPLLFKMNTGGGFSKTLSLAMKIQVVLISLVFLSLLAFGWGSGVFVSTQYNQFTNDVIREKLSSVETEVKAKLGDFEVLTITDNGNYMQRILQKFARVFFTDINMYDTEGYLLGTSRPKVFNVGLLSEQMNPTALKHVRFLEQSEFVHHENIGELNYSSAYKPFYNNSGALMGYINLQHFGQQREFENQIQKFLVAIINAFILLLAISIILAIFISSWLTAPLRILQKNFARVKFGKHNEQIRYDKQDEIGSLVKDYNQKLEELEFTAEQLAQSERELAWREMAKQVAHEIKNPLTPMKLSVQQLLRTYDPEDPKSAEKLKVVANSIIEQIDALTKIANEFSTFAKMPKPSEERLEINALINGVKEVFALEGKSKISYESNKEKIFVMADRDQFVRVFNNLLKNAIQSIPHGRDAAIDIRAMVENKIIQIEISDNGIGIEESKRTKIFVPYFTTKSTGTGLGLAMVKQIIENHRGQITFESTEDVGTTFHIVLPLA
jgi:signal transduction histidine kinase